MRIKKIEIERESGFCYGVIRAVRSAEENLREGVPLYSLGAIVHNNSELERLSNMGLVIIDHEQMRRMHDTKVLIRAHGEPPQTYTIAKENDIELIDCTCPAVLKLQREIAKTAGEIVIFGKRGHAEVNGLVGSAGGRAIVIENLQDRELEKIELSKPLHVFSQTTKDPEEYRQVCNYIKSKATESDNIVIHNTICRQVESRHTMLSDFSKNHDVIIFISGKESSNGVVLFDLCHRLNPRSHHIQSLEEIDKGWFKKGDSIGICGATSTPKWQLTSCRMFLKISLNNYIRRTIYRLFYGNYRRF